MSIAQHVRRVERVLVNFGDERLPLRFWDKVQPCPMSGCWLWTAANSRNGYGVYSVPRPADRPRKSWRDSGCINAVAHRVSYTTLVGRIPDGLFLDHLCRVTCCVNPMHLEPVTCKENTQRGLAGALVTKCPAGHLYDDANTLRRRDGTRRCRICNRASSTRHKQALLGFGRSGFRAGLNVADSIQAAQTSLGYDLARTACRLVEIGWSDECRLADQRSWTLFLVLEDGREVPHWTAETRRSARAYLRGMHDPATGKLPHGVRIRIRMTTATEAA